MSLLSEPFAVPSRVKGVVQLLVRERGQRLKRETAEQLLSPASLKGDESDDVRAMIHKTISQCVSLGLVDEQGDYIGLGERLGAAARSPDAITEMLPGVILDCILDAERSTNRDLANSLAWFLGQDVLEPPSTWTAFARALAEQGMSDELRFNDARYGTFSYWARYLGFANIVASPTSSTTSEQHLLPDPTDCLRRVLKQVLLRPGAKVTISECIDAVSTRCALFEGGGAREAVEASVPTREPKHFSTTTSHALLRLEEEGTIQMVLRSDADALILVDGVGRRAVSEVIRGSISGGLS